MADDDKVHTGLVGHFQPVYRQLVDGNASPEELAYTVLSPVREQFRWYQDAPVQFINQTAARVAEHLSQPLFCGPLDFEEEAKAIEALRRRIDGKPRGMNFAQNACFEVIMEVLHKGNTEQLNERMMHSYARQIYQSDFASIAPRVPPFNGSDAQSIVERLEIMGPFVSDNLSTFSRQLANGVSVEDIRLPSAPDRASKAEPYDIFTEGIEGI